MQKARSQAVRRRPSYRLSAHGFRIYFTRHLACFSPFPHGTSALSVIEEYLGLEGGPPSFTPDYSGRALLRNSTTYRSTVGYRPVTVFGAPFQGTSPSATTRVRGSYNPAPTRRTVWARPGSLAATTGISVDFSSSGY